MEMKGLMSECWKEKVIRCQVKKMVRLRTQEIIHAVNGDSWNVTDGLIKE